MPCPECNEKGCDKCDEGFFKLTDCPYVGYVDSTTSKLIRFADWFKRGIPPRQGGSLDQSAWFMRWCDEWWSWTDRLKAEALGKRDG